MERAYKNDLMRLFDDWISSHENLKKIEVYI